MTGVLCVMGPTASGKSDLAVTLAEQCNGEIISVDSALVYRGMDIGTAKPNAEIRRRVPHHLIDIRDPADPYSAANFVEDALQLIPAIIARGHRPILAGGTMLYFRALQSGLANLPAASPEIRAHLTAEAERVGWHGLHEQLALIDKEAAEKIKPSDPQRIQRALEVFHLTGKTLSSFWEEQERNVSQFDYCNIAIAPESRSVLHTRIEARFKTMLEAGFIEEVKALFLRGDLHPELPAIRAVGYRQAWDYLAGHSTYPEFVERATAATRQLAKRQLTWLRHWPMPITWFNSEDPKVFETVIEFLSP
jgi:tRNA dimethylallyltransferase